MEEDAEIVESSGQAWVVFRRGFVLLQRRIQLSCTQRHEVRCDELKARERALAVTVVPEGVRELELRVRQRFGPCMPRQRCAHGRLEMTLRLGPPLLLISH